MEERRMRWWMVETAKRGRAKGKRVRVTNREIWVEGRKWKWNKVEGKWEEGEGD